MKKLKMKTNKSTGKLITFCGLDGCGKTTMIKRIVEELNPNHEIMLTKEPSDFVRKSGIFRTYMDSPDHDEYDYRSLSLLAASDRVQHVSKEIAAALENGKIVISDRYFYSCLANLRARGFYTDNWIYEISKSIIRPDAAFFLDVPVETAIARVRRRPEEHDRYIDVDLQYKLREEYINICRKNRGVLIPTDISKEESFELVMKHISEVIV